MLEAVLALPAAEREAIADAVYAAGDYPPPADEGDLAEEVRRRWALAEQDPSRWIPIEEVHRRAAAKLAEAVASAAVDRPIIVVRRT